MKNYKLITLLLISHLIFSQNTVPASGAVNFDTSLKIGNQVSTSQDGQIVRLILQPYRHTGGPWNFKSRDSNVDGAFLDFDYGTTGTALTLTGNRRVGINSLIPLNTFEVKVPSGTGTSSVDGISIHDGGTYRLGINIGINTAGEYSFLQAIKGGIGQRNIVLNPTGGSVGIGTTTTGTHKLAVEGSIGAREIKVQATGWSDFVFQKGYSLPTLEEVEKHIKEKGHLENIPSEEEVLKNGINLGEINSKLLQKIEELTLYSIQQNKKIEEQAKEIEKLKALALRIEKIEKELGQK